MSRKRRRENHEAKKPTPLKTCHVSFAFIASPFCRNICAQRPGEKKKNRVYVTFWVTRVLCFDETWMKRKLAKRRIFSRRILRSVEQFFLFIIVSSHYKFLLSSYALTFCCVVTPELRRKFFSHIKNVNDLNFLLISFGIFRILFDVAWRLAEWKAFIRLRISRNATRFKPNR